MGDADKNKGQLLEEIEQLKQQIKELNQENIAKSKLERYKTIFSFSPEAIVILDVYGNVVELNGRLKDWLGYEPENAVGKNLMELPFLPDASKQKAIKMLSERISGEDIPPYELIFTDMDGNERIGRIYAKAVYSDKKEHIRDIVLISDITENKKIEKELENHRKHLENLVEERTTYLTQEIAERKRVEEKLRYSEVRWRSLVENAPERILVIDKDGKVTFINRGFFSHEAKNMVNTSIYEYLPSDEQVKLRENLRDVFELKENRRYIGSVTAPNGFKVWFDNSLSPVTYDDDSTYAIVISTEITEMIRTTNSLAAEKERLRVTLRSISDGVISTDRQGKILLMNEVAENLTGYDENQAYGTHISNIFHIITENSGQECEDPVKRVLQSGKTVDLSDDLSSDVLLVDKSGKEVVISGSAAPIHDKQNEIIGIVIVFHDITEQRKLEEELLKSQKLESIGLLAGGIAHDFNNILTGIMGNISLARMFKDPEKVKTRLLEAEKSSIRAKGLTNQLLTFAKGGSPVKKEVYISDIIKDSINFALHGSKLDCKISLPDNLKTVSIDIGQIQQAIGNIILNAEQAMPEGGKIEVYAKNIIAGEENLPDSEDSKYIKISIKDNGMGISKEHLPYIFDPYFSTKQKGSGLGLAVCYSIIKKHDGFIKVNSKLGEGTVLNIYLPAVEKSTEYKKQSPEKEFESGTKKILIMDDEEVIRDISTAMITRMGYEVKATANGQEAITAYKFAARSGNPFDLVILDLTVAGGMSGKETIRELSIIDPDVKAVVSSGYSSDPIVSKYRDFGFVGVISKPFKFEDLQKAINTFLV
ncbi:PAS domain S-box protein [Candidatus Poribacteria bacterium]|nr:PAS domain S-box protein [Candidatus Poribacteria bacterium]